MFGLRAEAAQAEGRMGAFGRRERLATVSQERVLPASLEEVWRVVGDPHHMPRWWPACRRMEGVDEGGFTQVFQTKRGRTVRMDFQVLESTPPTRLVFTQEVADTPFAGFLGESVTEISLHAVGPGTRVVLAQSHRLRGYSRTGAVIFRRAAGEKLSKALDGLAELISS